MRKQMWTLVAGALLAMGGTVAQAQGLSDMLGNNQPMPKFSKVDKNKDGYVERNEAKESDVTIARTMYRYDENKDGKLDQAEFSALEKKEPNSAEYWQDFFSRP